MHRGPCFALLFALLASRAPADDAPTRPLPGTAPGWSIELVAEGPRVAAPVMAAAPDGTLYLGHANAVEAFKGGKWFPFAGTLGKVHGVEWMSGSLIVAHGAVLSRLRDRDGDGRADQREDLATGLQPKSNKEKEAAGLDRCMGGIRLGLDGFLYMAVGDQGMPRATGKDGRVVSLHGGGVIRIRPDGSGLEVVSTGDCNPRSVVLTASGEIFTFGPSDPKNRWPGGLVHHIDGGHYGYPYQFLTAPFRSLPTLGGEAGTEVGQAICHNEDGFPSQYRGNFLVCETSRQRVDRIELRKVGGSHAIARRTALVTAGTVPSFHPIALAATGDGTGFWLADRGGGETSPARLYRLTYRGDDRVRPAPRPRGGDIATRRAAFHHPALSVRLEAQRSLASEGASALAELIRGLGSNQTESESETGRSHIVWALDAIGGGDARQAIRRALRDPSPFVRLQAARSCGIRADGEAASELARLLADRDPAVRREAAVALGRCGNAHAIAPLIAALADSDRFAAWSIRTAIRRLGYPDRDAMAAALLDPQRRESALILADESWSVPVVQALAAVLPKTTEPAVRGRIVACLAGQYRRYPEWNGDWWGPNPLAGKFPRKIRDWSPEGMSTVARGLRQGFADRDASVRLQAIMALGQLGRDATPILLAGLDTEREQDNQAAIVEALGELNDPAAIRELTRLVTDAKRPEPVRAAALDCLARFRGPDVLRARFAVLYDPKAPESLAARALPALARDGFLPLNDLAGFLENPSATIRAAALMSLNVKKAPPPEIARGILARLDDPASEVRQAAMLAVAALRMKEAVPKLLETAGDAGAALHTQAVAALCRIPDRRALEIYRQASAGADPSLRRAGTQALKALGVIDDPALVRAGGTAPRPPDPIALGRFALNHRGDPRAGEALFYDDQTVACARCHSADGKARAVSAPGPDLSHVGSRLDKAQIIATLLDPAAKAAPAHQAVRPRLAALAPLQVADLVSFLQGLKRKSGDGSTPSSGK